LAGRSNRSTRYAAAVLASTELSRDTDLLALTLDRAFEHVANLEIISDLPDIGRLARIDGRRVRANDIQVAVSREVRDDVSVIPSARRPSTSSPPRLVKEAQQETAA